MYTRDERQNLGIKKWIDSGFRGTWQWATGVGKTYGAMKVIKMFLTKNKNKKIIVIVPTEHLKLQWIMKLTDNNIFNEVDVQIINTAVTFQQNVDLLILDECHRYASELFYQIFDAKLPKLILGLSATFDRLDGKHTLLQKFCPVCDVITVEDAINNKWLSKYREYKVLLYPDDISEYRDLNESFFSNFAIFNHDFSLAMQCVAGKKKGNKIVVPSHKVRYNYAKSMCTLHPSDSNYYPTVKELNSQITAAAYTWNRALQSRKSYVMNHPLKVEITRKILQKRPFSKAITFSATIKQAEKIGIGYTVHSGKTKKRNRLTVEEFSKLPNGVLNTAKSLDEGADIPGLNLAVILTNSSSRTQKTQRIGRVIRYEEDKEAEIFTLVLANTNEEKWYNNSNVGKSYIEITMHELDDILEGRELKRDTQQGKKEDILFRL